MNLLIKTDNPISGEPRILAEDESVNLEELTDKQKNHLIETIIQYKKQNKQSKKKNQKTTV